MCIATENVDSILFTRSNAIFELRNLAKMKDTTRNSLSAQLLWNHSTELPENGVVMKDIICRCAYPQEILIKFFSSELRPFWTSKFNEMKDTTETVCQRNSSETAQ